MIRSPVLAVLLLASVGLAACKDTPAISTVRHEMERTIPGAEFEPEFHLRLGGVPLGLAKSALKWGLEEDSEEHAMLEKIKRVDVGSYRVVSLPPLDEIEPPAGLIDKLRKSGWSLTVRAQDEAECVWVFLRQDQSGGLRSIYVVVLDEVELTMIAVEGRLDELLAEVIASDPEGFVSGFGP